MSRRRFLRMLLLVAPIAMGVALPASAEGAGDPALPPEIDWVAWLKTFAAGGLFALVAIGAAVPFRRRRARRRASGDGL